MQIETVLVCLNLILWMGFTLRVILNYFIPVLMVHTVTLSTSINLYIKIKVYLMDSRVHQKERKMEWVGEEAKRDHKA